MNRQDADPIDALRALLLNQPGNQHVHLMGIGGVGMAGLAGLLMARGYRVTGCEQVANRLTAALESQGVKIYWNHSADHLLDEPALLVRSTAVSLDNPEIQSALAKQIPVSRRGELFPALLRDVRTVAVSGTHGKTTTTALCAHVLRAAKALPAFFIGGEWEADGRVFDRGDWSVTVVEADESDGTLVHYHPDIALITGIDYDHMEHFADEAAFVRIFETFASQTRDAVVYCADDVRLEPLVRSAPASLSYGFAAEAVMRASNLTADATGTDFDVACEGRALGRFRLSVPGAHNVQNAMGALTVAHRLGLPLESAAASLASFRPVRRRFECVGRWRDTVTVYSDYAHHPTEIKALLAGLQNPSGGRIIGLFQPHRYTRTRALGHQFPEALAALDHLILAPVYPASEQPLPGGTDADLVAHFSAYGHLSFDVAKHLDHAWELFENMARDHDMLLLIGAGDIDQLAKRVQSGR